jgi:hypothetical protein
VLSKKTNIEQGISNDEGNASASSFDIRNSLLDIRYYVFLKMSAAKRGMAMIRVVLPYHLRTLAQVGAEVQLDVEGQVTQRSILDALEARYPMLRGTIRDHVTQQRRPMLRFFACEEDLSLEAPDAPLPEAVASGAEAFWIVGAIAGG